MPPILVHLIAGARPNFMKVAPLWRELAAADWCEPRLVHTGQHYDAEMSGVFLRELGLPEPHHALGCGGGSHAEQTAAIMVAYEKVCLEERPDWVVVVGDVNSTVACTLTAKKLGLRVAHLEAGLRSFDRTMPEEINRLATDALADLLWTPSPDADENLRREGVPPARVERVGNIMIDTFEMMRPAIERAGTAASLNLAEQSYALVTMHRPSNVDTQSRLERVVEALCGVAHHLPVVFPVHPRTRGRLESFGLWDRLAGTPGMRLSSPLGYVEFANLIVNARFILTDSGGVQEESTYLGIPCLTLRDNTERPITVSEGSNRLIRLEALADAVDTVLAGPSRLGRKPELWDGRTAARVADSLLRHGRD